jgi:hypothetical protein
MIVDRRSLKLLAAVVLMLPMAACASIPDSSDVSSVRRMDEGNVSVPIPAPPRDVDAFTLVRSFVDSGGEPENDYAAARLHLTTPAQKSWVTPAQMLIVDNVDTIPVPAPPGTPDWVQLVSLQATKVGWLKPDQSFQPESGQYQVQVRVERQPDGQWRIATPPRELVASTGSFSANYKPVPVYFLDHDRSGVVPDLRYVVSQPASTLPRRVIDLLMMGPSEQFRMAMGSALPAGVYPQTNVSEAEDGALEVNLSALGDPTQQTRRLIAAQVVMSLESVSNARVRLLEDGAPLLPRQEELQPSDVASYDSGNPVRPDLPGLVVVDERLRTLDSKAQPVPGPAGSGEYAVVQAAQSPDGSQLAAVVRRAPGGVGLRVGGYGGPLAEVPLAGSFMSRPSWRGAAEFWTVVNGREVTRVVQGSDGRWITAPINAQEFAGAGTISSLRLSRDGTRVAGVVSGNIVVAGVSDQDGRTVLRHPTVLTGDPSEGTITGVDWASNDSLVAIASSGSAPVREVTVDGFKWTNYASANLVQPLTAVTVAPGHKVVVADHSGVWQASGAEDVWRLLPTPIGGSSIPFYPG